MKILRVGKITGLANFDCQLDGSGRAFCKKRKYGKKIIKKIEGISQCVTESNLRNTEKNRVIKVDRIIKETLRKSRTKQGVVLISEKLMSI